MNRTGWDLAGKVLLPTYFAIVIVYLLTPLLIIIPMSVTDTRYLRFPPQGYTLRWYGEFFSNPRWTASLVRSFAIAIASSAIAVALGLGAAMMIRRARSRLASLATGILLAPQIVPTIILALGVKLLMSQFRVSNPYVVIVLVHAVLALPFVLVTMMPVMAQLDESLERAARGLGANRWQTFWKVVFPAIRPAVTASAVFAFFISFDELVVALFIMGQGETLQMRIWGEVRQELTPVIAAATTFLIVATIAAVTLAQVQAERASRRLVMRSD